MGNMKEFLAILMAFVILLNIPIVNATPLNDEVTKNHPVHAPKAHSLEKHQVNYTKVDTAYGQINVPNETYLKMGKEKIAEKYSEFLKLQEEFKKMDKKLGINRSDNIENFSLTDPLPARMQSQNLLLSDSFTLERVYFDRGSSSWQPMLLYGRLNPTLLENPDGGRYFNSYQEREIYLNNNMDCIEIISDQRYNGETVVWVAIYDNNFNQPVSQSVFDLSIVNVVNPIEYDVILDSEDQSYDIWLVDTVSGSTYFDSYPDTDNFSSFITYYDGSTELHDYSDYVHPYRIRTNFVDYYTKVNGYIVQPYNIFNNINVGTDSPYVYAYGYGANGQTYSYQAIENPDPWS
ncbi:MAG: hypothetical protein WBZ29_15405 [Methanocella sp.]